MYFIFAKWDPVLTYGIQLVNANWRKKYNLRETENTAYTGGDGHRRWAAQNPHLRGGEEYSPMSTVSNQVLPGLSRCPD